MSETLDTAPPTATGPEPQPPRRGAWWWTGLRPLVRRLHFYAGMLVGPFVLVAALTGLLYTLTPQIEQAVHRDALTAAAVGTEQVELSRQVQAAQVAVPGGTITEIRPPSAPDGTTRVSFDAPGVREDFTRTVFVDPYSGQVRAVLDTFGQWLPVRAWFDELHRTLLLGEVGRMYSELAASWLGVLALSGIVIWVARRRRAARLRRTLLPQGSARGRARLQSWHGSVGLWAAIGMVFLSATGLTWSQFAGSNVTQLRAALDWSTPAVATVLPAGTTAVPIDVGGAAERVLAAARTAGLADPVAITPRSTGAWTVKQVERSWPVRQDAAAVDPATGAVVDTVRFDDWPLAAKLSRWGIDAHMGLLFGVVNQVLLAALALAIVCLVVWGYRMWWLRRPTRAGAATPAGMQRPGAGAVIVVGLVAIAAGVLAPLLGVSVLVFLVGDAVRLHLRDRPTADST